jgi:DNA-binding transcriptional MerR regulator/predicted RNase H-like HicB family nuclease
MPVSDGFSADVARRAVGITYRQLDYWDKTGLVRPSIKQARGKGSRRVYSFEDLVELRVIAQLLKVGVPLPAVRNAARYVRQHFAELVRPLARLSLIAEGKRILVRATARKALLDATSGGQVVISVSVAPIAEALRGKVSDLQAPRSLKVRVGQRTFAAVLTPDLAAGGYSIAVPELPGVITEADTITEARQMTADAIRLWLSVADSASSAPRRRIR